MLAMLVLLPARLRVPGTQSAVCMHACMHADDQAKTVRCAWRNAGTGHLWPVLGAGCVRRVCSTLTAMVSLAWTRSSGLQRSDMKPTTHKLRTRQLIHSILEQWCGSSGGVETQGSPSSYLLNLQALQTFPQGQDELLRLAVEGAQVRHGQALRTAASLPGLGNETALSSLSACEEPSWPSPKS